MSFYEFMRNNLYAYTILLLLVFREWATSRRLPSETATSRFARRKLLCLPPPLLIDAIQQFATRRAGQSWSPLGPPRPSSRACLLSVLLPLYFARWKAAALFRRESLRQRGAREETRKEKSRRDAMPTRISLPLREKTNERAWRDKRPIVSIKRYGGERRFASTREPIRKWKHAFQPNLYYRDLTLLISSPREQRAIPNGKILDEETIN